MSRIKTIIALIFAICVAVFAVQNYDNVLIKFLFYQFKVSQALIIVLSTALGVIIGLIAGLNSSFKASKLTKQLNRDYKLAQEKISSLETEKKALESKLEELNNTATDLLVPEDSFSQSMNESFHIPD